MSDTDSAAARAALERILACTSWSSDPETVWDYLTALEAEVAGYREQLGDLVQYGSSEPGKLVLELKAEVERLRGLLDVKEMDLRAWLNVVEASRRPATTDERAAALSPSAPRKEEPDA